jgi:mannose-6-phosphate isomerase-like protein (cupin superfamily)
MPLIFHGDLEDITKSNKNYRRVLFTAKRMQLVTMSIRPGELIPLESHADHDQFLRVDGGRGELRVGKSAGGPMTSHPLRDGFAALIPAGVFHEVVNTSRTRPLQLYTVYTPPEHRPGTVHLRQK